MWAHRWKGVGGLLYGSAIAVACMALLLSLIQTFRIHQDGTNTQNQIDAISDGTAYYMSTQSFDAETDDSGGDTKQQQSEKQQQQKKYTVAQKEASKLNTQIAQELHVAPLSDLSVNQKSLEDNTVAVQAKSSNSYMNRFFQREMNSQYYFIYRHAQSKYNSGMFGGDVDIHSKYYIQISYGGLNPFPPGAQEGLDLPKGSALPDCTSYAYGRVYEVSGTAPTGIPHCGAGGWYANATCPKGQSPKVGAVICYNGHVSYIESMDSTSVTISDSNAYHQLAMNQKLHQPGMAYSVYTWPLSRLGKAYGGHAFQGYLYPQTVAG